MSDMRMPGMDGWQLLAEVKKLYPHTVRLLLSGQAESTSVMRAVGTAQQWKHITRKSVHISWDCGVFQIRSEPFCASSPSEGRIS